METWQAVTLNPRVVDQGVEDKQHDPGHDRRHHVGYYLISRGRLALEKAIN